MNRHPHPLRRALGQRAPVLLLFAVTGCGDIMAGPPSEDAVGHPLQLETVAAGYNSNCGLAADGMVFCWGDGFSSRPQLLRDDLHFHSIAAGHMHYCGITVTGESYCWGFNRDGQLGVEESETISTPVRVTGDEEFRETAAGAHHTCALAMDGTAYCWGNGSLGQRGTGSLEGNLERPTPVVGGQRFGALAAGFNQTCATSLAGNWLYCWGAMSSEAVPNFFRRYEPKKVLVDVAGQDTTWAAFAQITAGSQHVCGVTSAGKAYCWGDDSRGQTGVGADPSGRCQWVERGGMQRVCLRPTAVEGGHVFRSVHAGGYHTCGLTHEGRAYCWGYGLSGQLGDARETEPCHRGLPCARSPQPVWSELSFEHIAAGLGHTCGKLKDRVVCWGANRYGQLGDGTQADRTEPTTVLAP